jgi:hypothetical protein
VVTVVLCCALMGKWFPVMVGGVTALNQGWS